MFKSKRDKEERRYYLLPGMGRSNKRHREEVFKWSIAVGIIAATLFGLLLYYLNRY